MSPVLPILWLTTPELNYYKYSFYPLTVVQWNNLLARSHQYKHWQLQASCQSVRCATSNCNFTTTVFIPTLFLDRGSDNRRSVDSQKHKNHLPRSTAVIPDPQPSCTIPDQSTAHIHVDKLDKFGLPPRNKKEPEYKACWGGGGGRG